MTKKDEIQLEIINKIIEKDFRGIVRASVRTGKTRILLTSIGKHCFNLTGKIHPESVLVLYPNIDIKTSWENECKILNYFPKIKYCTFASIDKIKNEKFDYVIIDEAHLLGKENQLPVVGMLAKNNKNIIFASGTYNNNTLLDIQIYSELDLIVDYTTEMAIEDGIVSDFTIFIHKFNLDNTNRIQFGKVKKWISTEKKECDRISRRIQKTYGKEKMFHSLARMRFINSCNSLINSVNSWIENNKDERFILFTGSEEIGKKYNIPMFNSKSKDDTILQDFISGKINQLCLIRKGSAGVTYPILNNILITSINSNGENLEQMIGRSLLNDTEHSNIHIFISTEDFQLKWMKSALEGINKDKIVVN